MRLFRLSSYNRPLRRKSPSFIRDLSPHMRRDIELGACSVPPRPPFPLYWLLSNERYDHVT